MTTRSPARKRARTTSKAATPPPPDDTSDLQAIASPHLWMRKKFCLKFPRIIHGQGRFWQYKDGIWTEIPLPQIRRAIVMLADDPKNQYFQVTSSSVASVADLIRDHRTVADAKFDANPDILVFNDCVLDLNTFKTRPHDPKDYATSKLPFNYDPNATSAAWSKWAQRIDPELVSYLEEYAGLCMTTDQRFEKMVWLVGPPNCGKGTFILAVQTALGVSRWTTLSPSDIGNRFGLVNLAGKTLAIAAESPPIKTQNCIDVVDRIVSGEPIRVEQKGQPSYDLTPRCKLLCAMNVKPAVSNPDSGIFRRTDVVPMPALNGPIDPELKPQIANDGPAMINVFLAGLKRLRERGHFIVPRSVEIASAEFRAENDHVAMFLDDSYTRDASHKERASAVMENYLDWCKANGFREPLDSRKLKAELERHGAVHSHSNGKWYAGFKPV